MTNAKSTRKTPEIVTATEPVPARKAKSSRRAALEQAKSASKTPTESATESGSDLVANSVKPKAKLVRDSFTIPKSEYAVLEGLKVRAAMLTRPVKKSELLRAGVAVLNSMPDKAFLAALNGVPSLKTGRPKGAHAASLSGRGTI